MTIAVAAFFQLLDQYGKPVSGGRVYTYAAGTLNPLASYTDQSGTVPNANPVILDGAGRAQIWLTANVPYKLVGRDSADVAIPNATTDNYYAGASPEQLTLAGIVPATGGTYTGPVNLNGGVTFGGTAAQDLATLDSLNIANVQNANLWQNSAFTINQRGASSVADAAYGFDRTKALCDTGSVTLSQLVTPLNGIPYALRTTQPDASAKRIGLSQVVEFRNCAHFRGANVVLAAKVRCSAAVTVRCALVSWNGTLDAPTSDPVNNWASTNYTASNFFPASTDTIAVAATVLSANTWTDVSVSSISAGGVVAPNTMNNLYMLFWTDSAVAQNVTLDVGNVRAGQGTQPPLWLMPDASAELARVKRYFQLLGVGWKGAAVSATQYGGTVTFPAEMRATPAMAFVADGSTTAFPTGGGAITITPNNTYSADYLKTANATSGGTYLVLISANAEL